MSEFSGSYMRMTSDHSFPSSRAHNQFLSKLVVPTDELEGSVAERGLNLRPQNQNAKYMNVRTLYDREPNSQVIGGSFLNGNHWRLKRDPTWYQGRGKQRAVDVFGSVAKIAEGVGKVAAAVG